MLNFPRLQRGILLFVLEWKEPPHFTILTPTAPFDSRIEPENSKSYVFEQFLNIPSILNLFLSLFLG